MITVLFHLIVAVILLLSFLHYTWPPKDMPVPKESEIMFGGEYVMLGNVQAPSSDEMSDAQPEKSQEDASVDGQDMENSGEQAMATPDLVTSQQELPIKVKKKEKKPEKTGPIKPEKPGKEREKRENEKTKNINKNVASSFNKKGKGKEGSPNGNSNVGARSGAPGHSLKGRTLESWDRASSHEEGTVIIEVRVNPRGKVISAHYVGGKGAAAANQATRRSCEQSSLRCRFSVSTETTTEQTGRITWRFE